ncbi:hypothetical protein [Desulforhabdus sp. TSK]|uniref:hypothetical protein n=1 Tax=Desulforhabdus sp. TSK TaxID=2925014 RepID=UPI001FC83601|nr:hypothetical protein [Desulforhabdus sp. TSK]GKT09475.1 hypothetical protein DSTSK_27800 [Desulforhabdus sp. TSK]
MNCDRAGKGMLDFILLFFGATLVYAGLLMGAQDIQAGIASGVMGACLSVRPLMRLWGWARVAGGIGGRHQGKRRKPHPHIQIVRRPDEDEEHRPPTYH